MMWDSTTVRNLLMLSTLLFPLVWLVSDSHLLNSVSQSCIFSVNKTNWVDSAVEPSALAKVDGRLERLFSLCSVTFLSVLQSGTATLNSQPLVGSQGLNSWILSEIVACPALMSDKFFEMSWCHPVAENQRDLREPQTQTLKVFIRCSLCKYLLSRYLLKSK